jgi:hypothetical protein
MGSRGFVLSDAHRKFRVLLSEKPFLKRLDTKTGQKGTEKRCKNKKTGRF